MATKTVLIVDDDPTQRRLLQAVIERQNMRALQADGGQKALDVLASPDGAEVSCVLLDLVMPGMNGFETLKEIRARALDLPVIVLTASGGIDTVVAAMQAGATDFFVKPASPERILVSIQNALKLTILTDEVKRLKRSTTGRTTFADMIAHAPAMLPVIKLAERGAKSNIPILVLGESGVGKELIARAIHGSSDRAGKAFVAVNCGAIPENLVESILFGHEKGAFTGAVDKHVGKFQEADGGVLFLDEVGELPPAVQVKLLRALQEGEVDPVGAKRPVKVDVRIVAATNKDLGSLVSRNEFREDLYYRLNVFPVEAPPLRARKEDIPALVEHFIKRFNAEEGKRVVGASPEAMQMLLSYDWPGNVRQLENTLYRAVVLADGPYLSAVDFPSLMGVARSAFSYAPAAQTAFPAAPVVADASDTATPVPTAPISYTPPPLPAPAEVAHAHNDPIRVLDETGHLRPLEEIERDLIQFAIETYAGHMSEIARRLGIGRSTLYRKVREQGLDVKFADNDLDGDVEAAS